MVCLLSMRECFSLCCSNHGETLYLSLHKCRSLCVAECPIVAETHAEEKPYPLGEALSCLMGMPRRLNTLPFCALSPSASAFDLSCHCFARSWRGLGDTSACECREAGQPRPTVSADTLSQVFPTHVCQAAS